MNLVRPPLWPAALAGVAFAVLHAALQWLRGGLVDPVLAALSGLAVALAWLGPSIWALYRVRRPPQRWTMRQTGRSMPGPGTGDRFDKFTERTRNVLRYAQEEAQRLSHNYIGTEHLLLGLVREGEGIAAGILESHGIRLEQVREQVLSVLNQPPAPPRPAEQPGRMPPRAPHPLEQGQAHFTRFSEGARKALQLAQEEATRLGQTYLGTEHLLVGLLAEGHGRAALALRELGLDLDRARQELARLAGEGDGLPRDIQVGLTAQARRMIEQTTRAAFDRHAQEVGTEHLLLGLLAVDDAAGVRLLERLGTSREAVRAALERHMS
jgi:ATP-dependent Clp protease ATP-binding subunit ClpA